MAWSIDIHIYNSNSLMPSNCCMDLVLFWKLERSYQTNTIILHLHKQSDLASGRDDHCNKGGVTLMLNTIHELVWYVRKSKCSHLVSLFAMPTIPIFYLFSLLQSTQPRYITVWRWGKCLCFTFHSFAMKHKHFICYALWSSTILKVWCAKMLLWFWGCETETNRRGAQN